MAAVAAVVAGSSVGLALTAAQTSTAAAAPVTPLAFQKSSSTANFSKVGDKIRYTFVATNNSAATITGVGVTDAQAAPAGPLDAAPVCITVTNPVNACTGTNTTDLLSGDTIESLGVPLGTAGSFSVLGTAITNAGATQIGGDLGTTATPSDTGFPPGHVAGGSHFQDAAADQAKQSMINAYNAAMALTPTSSFAGDQSGVTFTPGAHHTAVAFSLAGTLTLDGQGDPNAKFVIQVDAAAGLTAGAKVILTNGAHAANVTWVVNGAIGVAAGVTLAGNLISDAAITLGDGANLDGRAWAYGAVTLSNNNIPTVVAIHAPGQTATYTATYTVTQQDIDNGFVRDTATASGGTANSGPMTSDPSTVSVPAVQNPALTVKKSTTTRAAVRIGQVIPYSFVVTNPGNVTMKDVSVGDVQGAPGKSLDAPPACQSTTGPAAPCTGTSVTLAPGQSGFFTGTYTVSQADFDNGSVNDSATASGTSPAGTSTTSDPSTVSIPATPPVSPTVIVTRTVQNTVRATEPPTTNTIHAGSLPVTVVTTAPPVTVVTTPPPVTVATTAPPATVNVGVLPKSSTVTTSPTATSHVLTTIKSDPPRTGQVAIPTGNGAGNVTWMWLAAGALAALAFTLRRRVYGLFRRNEAPNGK